MSEPPLCEAMVKIAMLANALGASPITRFADCWERRVDDDYMLAVNGHPAPRRTTAGVLVQPFHAVVFVRGWPFAILSPFGGWMGCGEGANEDAFIAALDRAIARASDPRDPTSTEASDER